MDTFHHSLGITQYLIIPETYYPIAKRLQVSRPDSILFLLFKMLAAVSFDNQPRFQANKIDYIRLNHNLALEFIACHSMSAQVSPQHTLCIR